MMKSLTRRFPKNLKKKCLRDIRYLSEAANMEEIC